MTNADKFKSLFGLYATELWAMPEKDFLKWLNSEAMNCSEFPNNSDTINRQDAIDAVEALAYHADKYVMDSDVHEVHGFRTGLAVAERQLSLVPSAQPERKTGKWIKLDAHAHLADHKCSACGQECYVPTCMGDPMYDFCPNCGADMRGDEHETD